MTRKAIDDEREVAREFVLCLFVVCCLDIKTFRPYSGACTAFEVKRKAVNDLKLFAYLNYFTCYSL
jgi:hypothetical protein